MSEYPPEILEILEMDHQILAKLARTPDEEDHILGWWLTNGYDTDGALKELVKYRRRMLDRKRARRRRPRATPEGAVGEVPCEPEDLVAGLTEREVIVWRMRADGFAQTEIARVVGVSQAIVSLTLDGIRAKAINKKNDLI